MDRHAQGILPISLSPVAYSSAGFFDAWTMLVPVGCSPAGRYDVGSVR
jgi:hypothetical protein